MNIFTKISIAASAAALFLAAPAIASAERVYFLVGTRHIYRIGTYQYAHLDERRAIEEDYADQVATDQDTYNKVISGGADPNVEGPQFNSALNDLAAERDRKLSALFENADYERDRHPQLRIEGDGPYQVIGINFHYHSSAEVFDNFVVYAPWPGYTVVDRPYGWTYGVVYTPGLFFNIYSGWHARVFLGGGPVFYGFYGHHGGWGRLPIYRGVHGGYAVHSTVGRVIGHPGGYGGSHYYGGSRYNGGRVTSTSRYTHNTTRTRTNFGTRSRTTHTTLGASRYSGSAHSSFGGGSHSPVGGSRYTGSTHSSFGGGSHSTTGGSRYAGSGHSSFGSGSRYTGSTHSSFGSHSGTSSFGARRSSGSFGSHSSSFGSSRTSTHTSGGGGRHRG